MGLGAKIRAPTLNTVIETTSDCVFQELLQSHHEHYKVPYGALPSEPLTDQGGRHLCKWGLLLFYGW